MSLSSSFPQNCIWGGVITEVKVKRGYSGGLYSQKAASLGGGLGHRLLSRGPEGTVRRHHWPSTSQALEGTTLPPDHNQEVRAHTCAGSAPALSALSRAVALPPAQVVAEPWEGGGF